MSWKPTDYSKVAELEEYDPEVGKLSERIRAADDAGKDTDDLNGKFERAVVAGERSDEPDL